MTSDATTTNAVTDDSSDNGISSREVIEETSRVEEVDEFADADDEMNANTPWFVYWPEMAIISSFGLFCLTMIFCIGVTSYIVYSRKRRRDEEM
eukprot:708537_1